MSNNLTKEATETTAGDIYTDLVAIERYLWLFKKDQESLLVWQKKYNSQLSRFRVNWNGQGLNLNFF